MNQMDMNRTKTAVKIIAVLCLIAGLLLGAAQSALAAQAVTYIDENGQTHTVTSYRELDPGLTTFGGGAWVARDTTEDNPAGELSLTADTVLILNGAFTCDRISLCGHSLTIYGDATAALTVLNKGISGSGTLTLCSGTVHADTKVPDFPAFGATGGAYIKGGTLDAIACTESRNAPALGGGPVTISGGEVKAYQMNAGGAAIGGGENEAGDVTITGGTVKAYAETSAGAIIGGGKGRAGNVTISGGTVEALSNSGHTTGAAIGGGENSTGGEITITGGKVTARSHGGGNTSQAPAIGSGVNGNCGAITISGGTVWAESASCPAIGSYMWNTNQGNIAITGGNVTAWDKGMSWSGVSTRFSPGRGLVLGWTDPGDRFSLSFWGDYLSRNVRFADGKYFCLGDTATAATPDKLHLAGILIPSAEQNFYRASFYTDASEEPWKVVYPAKGSSLANPGDPYKYDEQREFISWRLNDFSGSDYDFSSVVTGDVNLYAASQYPVTLKYKKKGKSDLVVYVEANTRMTRPDDPDMPGADFLGWRKTGDSADYDFSSAVTEPITLEARWEYHEAVEYDGGCTYIYTPISVLGGTTLTTGDYVVDASRTFGEPLIVSGTVNLILVNGKTLTASGGIIVNSGNTLNIYGQYRGTGKLVSTGKKESGNAGIGSESRKASGEINIYSGIVEATGDGAGAGIGGGGRGRGTVAIYGGTVKAESVGITGGGAGIGGGYGAGADIAIYGGYITATAITGAGIGGGYGAGADIAISGGDSITASSDRGAAIGGGKSGINVNVTISGGDRITASSNKGAAIGCGYGVERTVTVTFTRSFMLQETGKLATVKNINGKTIVPCYGVTFDANGGRGSMAGMGVYEGHSLTLPACGFTAPEGGKFICWQDSDGTEYQPGQTVTPTGDLALSAFWRTPQNLHFEGYAEETVEVIDDQGNITTQTIQNHNAYRVIYGAAPFTNPLAGAQTPVTWRSSDSTVATVDGNGRVTILGAGETVITATAARSDTCAETSVSYVLTVERRTVEYPVISFTGSFVYSGAPIVPAVTVKDGNLTIPESAYTVTATNNVKAGTATLTVTGVEGGNYLLEGAASFTIAPRAITVSGIGAVNRHYDGDNSNTSVELDFSNATLTGLVAGDAVGVTAEGAFADGEAGENKTVTLSGLTFTGRDRNNYTLAEAGQQTTAAATIYEPHTVRFTDENGAEISGVSAQTVLNGAKATDPGCTQTKDGFRQTGWKRGDEPFDFGRPLDFAGSEVITLTPVFSELYRIYPAALIGGDGAFTWSNSIGESTGGDVSSIFAVAGERITVTAWPDTNNALAYYSVWYEDSAGAKHDVSYTMTGENTAVFTMPAPPAGIGSEFRVFVTGSFVLEENLLDGLKNEDTGFYEIGSQADLLLLNTWMAAGNDMAGETIVLTADIDMTGTDFHGFPWTLPNVSTAYHFKGTFNGQGHTLSGVTVSNSGSAGLFRIVDMVATVENLTVSGSVSGGGNLNDVGGIAARNDGTIQDCVSLMRVTGSDNSFVGGVAGTNGSSGTVTGCCYLGMGGEYGTDSMNPVGSGNATDCTALYVIEGSDVKEDGIVTVTDARSGEGCEVDGYFKAGSNVTLTLSAGGRDGWALNGYKYKTEDGSDVNLTDNGDGTYLLADIQQNVILLPNYVYSGLSTLQQDGQNRYLIRTVADLRTVADAVAATNGCSGMSFLLANDLTGVGAFDGIAVGVTDEYGNEIPFNGRFDGGGHTISGMTVLSGAEKVGFIGSLAGSLTNLTLKNCRVTATGEDSFAGMLAGYFSYSDISNLSHCRVLGGSVTGASAGAVSGNSATEDNLYTADVTVVSGGETKAPGECGTAYEDNYSNNAACLAWTVRFLDGFGDTELAPAQLVADKDAAEKPTFTETPVREHYTFQDSWQREDGSNYTFSSLSTNSITEDTTLYAVWESDPVYIVTQSDGQSPEQRVKMEVFQAVAQSGWALPECFLNPSVGKVFDGWLYNGTAYNMGESITFSEDITLTAKWKAADYTITARTADYGTVSAPATANYGDTVTVTVTPDTGCEPVSLACETAWGAPVEISMTNDARTFTMPAQNVILTAGFRQVDYAITAALDHGDLWVNDREATEPFSAHYGDEVSVLPDEGYALDSLTVTQGETGVEVTEDTFTMPAGDVTVTAVFIPSFGYPDFTLPTALTTIEESAFEGMTNMTVVDVDSCTTIGKWAFKGCTGLTQIRLPKDCSIDPEAFSGCGTVYVFAPAGGTTENYCGQETNPCVFVKLEE